jgi:hypothetical protein
MRLERSGGETHLIGEVRDQAQLQGLLARIADLGLALKSLAPIAPRAVDRGALTVADAASGVESGRRPDPDPEVEPSRAPATRSRPSEG